MTQMIRTLRPLTLIAVLALSSAAFAGGTHGGGHGHDSDETAIGKPGVASKASAKAAEIDFSFKSILFSDFSTRWKILSQNFRSVENLFPRRGSAITTNNSPYRSGPSRRPPARR